MFDSYQLQLELAYRGLIAMKLLGELSNQQEPTLGLVREALSIVQSILERNDQDIQRGYQASVVICMPNASLHLDIDFVMPNASLHLDIEFVMPNVSLHLDVHIHMRNVL